MRKNIKSDIENSESLAEIPNICRKILVLSVAVIATVPVNSLYCRRNAGKLILVISVAANGRWARHVAQIGDSDSNEVGFGKFSGK